MIVSDDGVLLLEILEANYGKVDFWASLYAIVDIQINKVAKTASMNFYSDEMVFSILTIGRRNSFEIEDR